VVQRVRASHQGIMHGLKFPLIVVATRRFGCWERTRVSILHGEMETEHSDPARFPRMNPRDALSLRSQRRTVISCGGLSWTVFSEALCFSSMLDGMRLQSPLQVLPRLPKDPANLGKAFGIRPNGQFIQPCFRPVNERQEIRGNGRGKEFLPWNFHIHGRSVRADAVTFVSVSASRNGVQIRIAAGR
jgi:hypothetical protein